MGSNNRSGEALEADSSTLNDLDIRDTGVGDGNLNRGSEAASKAENQKYKDDSKTRIRPTSRPQVRRNHPQPSPQQAPSSAQSAQDELPATQNDSLSLAELRRLITDLPKQETRAYDFTYDDASSFSEELEEWFSYSEEEQRVLLGYKTVFEQRLGEFWRNHHSKQAEFFRWKQTELRARKEFIATEVKALQSLSSNDQRLALQSLAYIVCGAWGEVDDSTGQQQPVTPPLAGDTHEQGNTSLTEEKAAVHLNAIEDGVLMILECDGLKAVYDLLRDVCFREQ